MLWLPAPPRAPEKTAIVSFPYQPSLRLMPAHSLSLHGFRHASVPKTHSAPATIIYSRPLALRSPWNSSHPCSISCIGTDVPPRASKLDDALCRHAENKSLAGNFAVESIFRRISLFRIDLRIRQLRSRARRERPENQALAT